MYFFTFSRKGLQQVRGLKSCRDIVEVQEFQKKLSPYYRPYTIAFIIDYHQFYIDLDELDLGIYHTRLYSIFSKFFICIWRVHGESYLRLVFEYMSDASISIKMKSFHEIPVSITYSNIVMEIWYPTKYVKKSLGKT